VPIVSNFSVSQVAGAPENIVLTDTSSGSDGTITSRRVYIMQSDGAYLVQSGTTTEYEVWAYADSTITLDVLTEDKAVKITVQWMAGAVVAYDKIAYFGLTLYNETFDYEQTQLIVANNKLSSDNNFISSKSALRTYIDSGNEAVSLATDIVSAQICYDAATALRENSQYTFNGNS